jgi:quinol monooxygenase YgiN
MGRAFWALLGPGQVEPGCLTCQLFHEAGNPGVLLYVEEWETVEQLERHMRSARYERLLDIMDASVQPPVLRYLFVSETRGLDYLKTVRLGPAAPGPADSDALGPEAGHKSDATNNHQPHDRD